MASSEICSACVFPGYPSQYSDARRNAAIPVAVISMALLGVGLALFLSRRHERIVAVRNPWLTVLIALNTLLCMEVPYRELYGEESFSCVLQSLLPNVLFALLPSGLIVRFFGLYTNHLRQRAVLEVTGLTVTDADLGIVGMLPTEEVGDDEEGDRTLIPVRGVSDTSGGGVDSISTYERRQRATLTLGDAGAPPASQLLSAASTPRLGAPSDTASPLADAPAAAAAPRSPGGTGAEREVSHGPVAHTGSTAFESPRSDKWHRVAKVAPQQHPPDVRVGSADPGTGGKVSPAGPSQRKANCASAAVNAFYNSLDASLIYLRLHSAKSQAIALAILCVPRIAYYVARLVVTPAYRTVLAVGCRLDAVDMASFLAITVPFFVLTLPLLPRLVAQSDAFGIRYELGVQLLTFVPFVVWYFYGKYTDLDITSQNGDYSGVGIMLIFVLSSLWAPALMSFSFSDMPIFSRTPKVSPYGAGRLQTSNRYAAILASTAGKRVVDELETSRLLDMPPPLARILRVLETPPRRLLQQPDDLLIVAALLIGTGWGYRTMKGLVALELSGEPLAFIRASAALRTFAKGVSAADTLALQASPPPAAPPIVAGLGGVGIATSPQGGLSSVTPRLARPDDSPAAAPAAAPPQPSPAWPTSSSNRVRQRSPSAAPQPAAASPPLPLAGVASHLGRLLGRYVSQGAPLRVPLSPALVQQLHAAQEALVSAGDATAPPVKRALALGVLETALLASERELFEPLARGPVFRFVQQRRQFAAWAKQTRVVLTAATPPPPKAGGGV